MDQLNYQAGVLFNQGAFLDNPITGELGYISTVELLVKVLGENIGSLIDVAAATALLNQIFQPTPGVSTVVQGEDPVEAKTQELCSQGVVTLTSAAAEVASETTVPTDVGGATDEQGAGLSVTG